LSKIGCINVKKVDSEGDGGERVGGWWWCLGVEEAPHGLGRGGRYRVCGFVG